MKRIHAANRESGLTVVEVIVALVLIGIVATSAISFFISGIHTTSELQRKQGAVSLANTAMDRARAVAPGVVSVSNAAGDTHGLVKGRTQQAVLAARDAADPADIADMDFTYAYDRDPSLTGAVEQQWVPITKTEKVNSQEYTITTLIGSCYRSRLPVTTQADCVPVPDGGIDATGEPNASDIVRLYRIRVVVEWSAGPGETPQTYRIASLADPSADAVWNTIIAPFAYDDEYSVTAGSVTSQWLWVTANDTLDYDETGLQSPIVNLTQPPSGQGVTSVGTGGEIGGVTYRLPTDTSLSGITHFEYAIRDLSSITTDPATVTVNVLPDPKPDNLAVALGSSTVLNNRLLPNDLGTTSMNTGRTVRIYPVASAYRDLIDYSNIDVSPEEAAARTASDAALNAMGISWNSAGEVRYQAPGGSDDSNIDFYYYLVNEQTTDRTTPPRLASVEPARVSILAGACVNTTDFEVEIPADEFDKDVDLEINKINGNDPACQIDITDVDYSPFNIKGQIKVDGNDFNATDNRMGRTISYRFQKDVPFEFRITYQMYGKDGTTTTGATGVITVRVVPVANDDTWTVKKGTNGFRPANVPNGKLRDNDYPSGGGQVDIRIERELGTNCGTFTQGRSTSGGYAYLSNDGIAYRAPNQAKTCTFEYVLVGQGNLSHIVSEPATVTIEVTD